MTRISPAFKSSSLAHLLPPVSPEKMHTAADFQVSRTWFPRGVGSGEDGSWASWLGPSAPGEWSEPGEAGSLSQLLPESKLSDASCARI